MKVVLQQTVEKLGNPGDVVEVADGYARNYLVPRGLAVRATKGMVRHVESLQRAHAVRAEKDRSEARVPWESIRDRRVTADDWSRVTTAASAMHDAPLSIVDSGNVTLVDIRAKARRLSARPEGLDCIIVDYLQLMSHHRRVENRQQEIAEISRGLKLLAKELDIPVIAVSQLNRDPERRQDKRPQLSDLRESGAIEQDADIVMFLHREYSEDPATKGTAELIVAKHRNGPTGKVGLTFLPKLTKFADQATPTGAPVPN